MQRGVRVVENKSGNAPDADRQTLGVRAKLGYGVGDLAINLFFQSSIIFLLYFYTDIFGISAAAAATLFLVARLVDAVTDPMMGAWPWSLLQCLPRPS